MGLNIFAIYECYFNTGFIPAIDCFEINEDAPIYWSAYINTAILGGHKMDESLSDFIRKYTLIE